MLESVRLLPVKPETLRTSDQSGLHVAILSKPIKQPDLPLTVFICLCSSRHYISVVGALVYLRPSHTINFLIENLPPKKTMSKSKRSGKKRPREEEEVIEEANPSPIAAQSTRGTPSSIDAQTSQITLSLVVKWTAQVQDEENRPGSHENSRSKVKTTRLNLSSMNDISKLGEFYRRSTRRMHMRPRSLSH